MCTAPGGEGWVERRNPTGFHPRGHMRVEKKSSQLCQRRFIGKKKGQALPSSATVPCRDALLQRVFQTEIKLRDKLGKGFCSLRTARFALLYGTEASVRS